MPDISQHSYHKQKLSKHKNNQKLLHAPTTLYVDKVYCTSIVVPMKCLEDIISGRFQRDLLKCTASCYFRIVSPDNDAWDSHKTRPKNDKWLRKVFQWEGQRERERETEGKKRWFMVLDSICHDREGTNEEIGKFNLILSLSVFL